jgi:hypothetical protein
MKSAAQQGVGSGPVRFRSTWAQWAWAVGSVAVGLALAQVVIAMTTSPSAGSTFRPLDFFVVFVATFAVITAMVYHWQGATLTREALLAHNLRPRAIAWPDIESLTVEPLLWTHTVVVRETSGRRTRLRAPSTGPLFWDHDFDAKFQTIIDWHRALRT